jgi:hypothetical protein
MVLALGPDWEKAKTQAEVGYKVQRSLSKASKTPPFFFAQCLDYLFELSVKMKQAGIDTDWSPPRPAQQV